MSYVSITKNRRLFSGCCEVIYRHDGSVRLGYWIFSRQADDYCQGNAPPLDASGSRLGLAGRHCKCKEDTSMLLVDAALHTNGHKSHS